MQTSFPELTDTIVPLTNSDLQTNRKQIRQRMVQQFKDSDGALPRALPFHNTNINVYLQLREKFVPFMVASICEIMDVRILSGHPFIVIDMSSMFCKHKDLWFVDATEKEIQAYAQVVMTKRNGKMLVTDQFILPSFVRELKDELPNFLPCAIAKSSNIGDQTDGYNVMFEIIVRSS